MKTCKTCLALALSLLLALAPLTASADREWHRGNIHEFHVHDYNHWRGGYWYNGPHDGRLGWWWIVGGMWYFYPRPIYPYPDPYTPPVVIVEQSQPQPSIQIPAPPAPPAPPVQAQPQAAPQQAQFWYYCESSKTYYPYAPSCKEEWKKVPAMPGTP